MRRLCLFESMELNVTSWYKGWNEYPKESVSSDRGSGSGKARQSA